MGNDLWRDIRDYGAKGDGETVNTRAIQEAIDACATAGGGVVVVPPGTYVTGTIQLVDNLELHLLPGAVLKGSPNRHDYNRDNLVPENRAFATEKVSGAHLIIGYRCTNIAITGQGAVDGNSAAFLDTSVVPPSDVYRRRPRHFGRDDWRPGQMICLVRCTNVNVADVSLLNACYWTFFLLGCTQVRIRGLLIKNPPATPNGDGIDLDCCQDVTVSDCVIRSGDDCIALRGNCELLGEDMPCANIAVTNCVLSTPCCGVRLGVGNNGTIRDCSLNNLVITDTRTAICFMSRYFDMLPDGVCIENITVSNVQLDADMPLLLENSCTEDSPAPGRGIRNTNLSGFRGKTTVGARIGGTRDYWVTGIHLTDWDLTVGGDVGPEHMLGREIPYPLRTSGGPWPPSGPDHDVIPCAVFIRHAEDVTLTNVSVRWQDPEFPWQAAVMCESATGVVVQGGTRPATAGGDGSGVIQQ